jgi:dienelactone hydrolase
VIVTVIQVAFEGVRWQLAPAYFVTLYLFFVWSRPVDTPLVPGRWPAVVGIGLYGAAAALCLALPVFELPVPTGRYPVGTVTLHWVDPDRQDPRTDRPDGYRELMVQIWYPAARAGPGEPYRTFAETSFRTQQLALVRTHSARGVPLAPGSDRFPLVVFEHSSKGRRDHNVLQTEELASHGFVVVGVDHPYESSRVVFPDGRIARLAVEPPEDELRVRAADVRFVLDEMHRLDRADPTGLLTGRVDASRTGILGGSFGGAVAAELCLKDSRVKAGVNFDGLLYGDARDHRSDKPFMLFSADVPFPTAEDVERAVGPARQEMESLYLEEQYNAQFLPRGCGYWLTVRGSRHTNFADTPRYSPFTLITRAGPISPGRATEIINAYVLSFFRAYLEGRDEPLLNATTSPYPEVELKRSRNDKHWEGSS